MKLYNVIMTDETARVLSVKHFATRSEAWDSLDREHDEILLRVEGMLTEDDHTYGTAFTCYYEDEGDEEHYYHAEVVISELSEGLENAIAESILGETGTTTNTKSI